MNVCEGNPRAPLLAGSTRGKPATGWRGLVVTASCRTSPFGMRVAVMAVLSRLTASGGNTQSTRKIVPIPVALRRATLARLARIEPWSCDGIYVAPPSTHAAIERPPRNRASRITRPLVRWFRFSKRRHQSRGATVAQLFRPRCPPAVVWLVVASIVPPIQRQIIAGAMPHISKEVEKRGTPSLAHLNAARAVVPVCLASRICATLDHGRPSEILRRETHAVMLKLESPLRYPRSSAHFTARRPARRRYVSVVRVSEWLASSCAVSTSARSSASVSVNRRTLCGLNR